MSNAISTAAFHEELKVAIEAVLAACRVTQHVQRGLRPQTDAVTKADKTPVTIADFASQAVVSYYLTRHFGRDPLVGEEEAGDLRSGEGRGLRAGVLAAIRRAMQSVGDAAKVSDDEWIDLIDHGSAWRKAATTDARSDTRRYWTIDPIDGTKGFLRQQQYAVCLALIENDQVQVGVLGCPNLKYPHLDADTPTTVNAESGGSLFWAVRGQGAYQAQLSSSTATPANSERISVSQAPIEKWSMLESYESSHSNQGVAANARAAVGMSAPPVRMDSQCKYGALARGDGQVYMRILADPTYKEKIWDHASGVLIVQEAGGIVTDAFGNAIHFNPTGLLSKNTGIVATAGPENVHKSLLAALHRDKLFEGYIKQHESDCLPSRI